VPGQEAQTGAQKGPSEHQEHCCVVQVTALAQAAQRL